MTESDPLAALTARAELLADEFCSHARLSSLVPCGYCVLRFKAIITDIQSQAHAETQAALQVSEQTLCVNKSGKMPTFGNTELIRVARAALKLVPLAASQERLLFDLCQRAINALEATSGYCERLQDDAALLRAQLKGLRDAAGQ